MDQHTHSQVATELTDLTALEAGVLDLVQTAHDPAPVDAPYAAQARAVLTTLNLDADALVDLYDQWVIADQYAAENSGGRRAPGQLSSSETVAQRAADTLHVQLRAASVVTGIAA